MVTTGGKVCIFVGFIVLFAGLFITMNTLVGLFLILAGIITIIQGARMKPLPGVAAQQPTRQEPRTYTLTPRKDTKGALSNVKSKGAV